jgi:hypothetical protein
LRQYLISLAVAHIAQTPVQHLAAVILNRRRGVLHFLVSDLNAVMLA